MGFGIGALVGSQLLDTAVNYWSAREARRADQASVARQMEFQDQMSSTAHQRQVADLNAAGLNPVLSANGGASSPSGSAYDAESMLQGPARGTLATAIELKRLKADLAEQDARTKNIETDTRIKQGGIGSKFFGSGFRDAFSEFFRGFADGPQGLKNTGANSARDIARRWNTSKAYRLKPNYKLKDDRYKGD